ncbi:hypothetical protein BDP81DRAFT_28550 [Colletotrichum phormii]|uniref:Uncharacterized protein n=1 Tax=Colletotrichum phormii TaxID=359342 RepID=A0AAJ0EFC1_9PEZI|nr:uncharacterized protein BDP81DRAFT_28550 [Colletotrichum phormii]KAK1636788.1 hypothetical protein BDP81DRAFT_28550 [Colletotrichum phormii]
MLRDCMIASREGGLDSLGPESAAAMMAMATRGFFFSLFRCQHLRSKQMCFWVNPIRKLRSSIRRDQRDGVSFPNPARSDTAALSDITASQSVNLQKCGSTHILDMAYIAYLSQRLCGVTKLATDVLSYHHLQTVHRRLPIKSTSRQPPLSPPLRDRYRSLDSHPANKAKNSHSTASSYGG